jgi:23S rRNA (adenine2503-C2)-methyltransferase
MSSHDLGQRGGGARYRAKQIMDAVYRQRVESLEEISTLPQEFREKLAERAGSRLGRRGLRRSLSSVDGTVRYLIGFADGQSVETVWMPEGDGGEAGDGSEAGAEAEIRASTSGAKARSEEDEPGYRSAEALRHPKGYKSRRPWGRSTICISSQVGCAVDCQFCLTALLGVKRNLTAGEIVGQVCAVLKDQKVSPPEDRINLVFMGMGEPFLNYENFIKASRLLVEGVGIAERRMTVSTAGIVPRIHDFGARENSPEAGDFLECFERCAAHAADAAEQEVESGNADGGGAGVSAAHAGVDHVRVCAARGRERRRPENAKEVAELLRGLRCKVNLIALNPGPGIDFTTPAPERVAAFQKILREAGIPAFVRRPRGRDIYAACGQLKRTVEVATLPEPQDQTISPAPE